MNNEKLSITVNNLTIIIVTKPYIVLLYTILALFAWLGKKIGGILISLTNDAVRLRRTTRLYLGRIAKWGIAGFAAMQSDVSCIVYGRQNVPTDHTSTKLGLLLSRENTTIKVVHAEFLERVIAHRSEDVD